MVKAFARPSDSLMIGDDLFADIYGAREAGINQVFFNPNSLPIEDTNITHEISCLSELEEIL